MGLKIHGLAELRKELADIADLNGGEIAKKMLTEGTKDVLNTWRNISYQKHRLTGDMYRAIKSSKPKSNKYGRYTVTYPRDYVERTRRGKLVKVRNAEKAFYTHYGFINNLTGKFVKGDRFVEEIDNIAEKKSDQTMQKILDAFIGKKGK